jgi:hypothetical protein
MYFLHFINELIAPICTLLAGYIGVRYGLKQIIEQKRVDFVERQLREFYSPIIGFRKEIQAKSALRLRISNAANEAWQEFCATKSHPFEDHDKEFEPYRKTIEYDNAQLENELMPLYEKMLKTFSENYWLADPETAKWYPKLCDFVELWRRWLLRNIPSDVIKKIDASENQLLPFYDELENRLAILKKALKGK